MKEVNVLDIVREYLESNGYDGLCNYKCGCSIDDLEPCGEIKSDCIPAYAIVCSDCALFNKCSFASCAIEYKNGDVLYLPQNCFVEKAR